MAHPSLDKVIRHLRILAAAQTDRTDGELLRAFSARNDQEAFAALARRHGPLVFSVCRRVLHHLQDAEDAFQATFIVLAKKASSLCKKGSLSGWLHQVSYRIALDARKAAVRRRKHERQAKTMVIANPAWEAGWREVQILLDEEIQRLPDKYREPFILCCLERQTSAAAARRMGLKEGTVRSRLSEARKRLQNRLSRRGVELTAVLGAAALAPNPTIAAAFVAKAVSAATAPGLPAAGAVALLVKGMTKTLFLKKAKFAVGMFLAVSTMVGVTGMGVYQAASSPTEHTASQDKDAGLPPGVKEKADAPAKRDLVVAIDQHGDPLLEGAIARLGSMRFRGPSFAFAFSLDGKILASAGRSLGLRLWEAATGRLLHRLPFPNSCESLAVSADGKSFVAGGDIPCLIDMETGKKLREFELPAGYSEWCVALSPDGRTLAAGSGLINLPNVSTTVVLLDVATGQLKRRLKDFGAMGVRTVAFSPDGKLLAAGSHEKTVYLLDVKTGKEWRRFGGHEQPVGAVAFAPKGRYLASCDNGGSVQLWNLETGLSMHTLKAESYVSPLAFSPDGQLLAYELRPGTVCLWNPETGKEVRQWAANTRQVTSLAFSPNGKVLVSGGGEGAIRRWDTATGMQIEPDGGHTGGVASLLFAPDGKTLFSGGTDWKVFEWDLASGRQRRQLFAKPPGPEARWPMSNYALAPDARTLAWTGLIDGDNQSDRFIHLWDVSIEKEIRSLSGHEDQIWSLLFSPDAKHLASSGIDGTRLWEVATGRELHFLRQVLGAAFSPDGKLLAGTKKDFKTIGLWEVATGQELRTWDSLDKGPYHACTLVFSPTGKSLASIPTFGGAENGRFAVRVWDIETGKQLARFEHHQFIEFLAFSPSGRILAAAARNLGGGSARDLGEGSKDQSRAACTIYTWDVLSGEEIQRIQSPVFGYSLAFAPNGRILAAGNIDSTILLWDLTGRARDSKPQSISLSTKEVEVLWSDLASDAARAQKAIWALAFAPRQSMALLKDRMLVPPVPADKVAKLVADLDSDRFAVRQEAAQTLEKMSESAEGSVRKHLDRNPTLEVRQRLSRFLEKREKETLRKLRAIEVLEQIGTPEARQVLEVLGVGAANPLAQEAARAALKRLANRAR